MSVFTADLVVDCCTVEIMEAGNCQLVFKTSEKQKGTTKTNQAGKV